MADRSLQFLPSRDVEEHQIDGWTYYDWFANGITGTARHLTGHFSGATMLKATIAAPVKVRCRFRLHGVKLLFALGSSLGIHAGDKNILLHDRQAWLFGDETKTTDLLFPLAGELLFVIIEYDDLAAEHPLPDYLPTSRPLILKREALDLLGALLLDPLIGHHPSMADDMHQQLFSLLTDHPFYADRRTASVSLLAAAWFYREKGKLIVHALQLGSADEIVQTAALENPFRFRKLLRQLYEMTIWELVMEIRMGEAVRRLKDPEQTIKLIARKTGFRSTNYFTRSFRKYFGITPKRFRDMQQT